MCSGGHSLSFMASSRDPQLREPPRAGRGRWVVSVTHRKPLFGATGRGVRSAAGPTFWGTPTLPHSLTVAIGRLLKQPQNILTADHRLPEAGERDQWERPENRIDRGPADAHLLGQSSCGPAAPEDARRSCVLLVLAHEPEEVAGCCPALAPPSLEFRMQLQVATARVQTWRPSKAKVLRHSMHRAQVTSRSPLAARRASQCSVKSVDEVV